MSNAMPAVRRESPWRRVRECVFALCTLWLLVQNTLLLVVVFQRRPDSIALAFEALQKALVLMTPLWVLPAAGLCGLALTTYLARGAAADPGADNWEMQHGRSR